MLNKRGQSNAKLVMFIVIYWIIFGIFFLSFSIGEETDLTGINTSFGIINTTISTDFNNTVENPNLRNTVPAFSRFGFQVNGIPFALALIINIPPFLTLVFMIAQLIRGSN